ncbi:unnamed protein product [Orchesella dallaii]|uniref:EGF-like domain-containing protein n=1 Tax=Orchesella dallaii TaxID=48710 RepID=A0ABP1PW09_9HEXA
MGFLQPFPVLLIVVAGLLACTSCDEGGLQHLDKFKGLGDNCEDNATCTVDVEFSFCNLTVDVKHCACLPAYVPDDRTGIPEKCLLKATELEVPDSCEIQTQCRDFENSECRIESNAGQCVCIGVRVPSDNKLRCLTGEVPIGQPCEEDQQCVGGPNSACSISKRCECTSGWVSNSNNTECLIIVDNLLGDYCTETIQCQRGKPGDFSECIAYLEEPNKKCNCTNSAIVVGNDNICYPIVSRIGNACEKDQQCIVGIGGSTCVNKVCECNSGFFPSNDGSKCLQQVELDKPCQEDQQCTQNAICLINATNPNLGKVCQCDAGYVGAVNTCYAVTTAIGGFCNDDIQCKNLEANCIQYNETETTKTCQCTVDEIENSSKTKCLARLSKLNVTCEDSIQCQMINNSECYLNATPNQKKCQCRQNDYVESWERPNTCVLIGNELNAKCDEDRQCIEGIGNLSECADGKCQCKRTYGYYNGSCYIPAKLDQKCDYLEECQVGVNQLAFCQGGYCRCQSGTIRFDEKCYLNKTVGDPCESNIECTVGIQGQVQCDGSTKSCKCGLGYSPDPLNKVCTSGSTPNFQFSLYMCVIMLIMSSFSLKNSVYW